MFPIILIPAFQPDAALLRLLKQLVDLGSQKIVVVNDGSGTSCHDLFRKVEELPGVILLVHPENRGKGAALRTGFMHITEELKECRTVVTADADGQHKAKDILFLARYCQEHPERAVLGARQFDGYVPLRSRIGNNLTRALLRILFQLRLTDTQTGLRGLPVDYLNDLCSLKGERYSYELEMLLWLNLEGLLIDEVPISTVYEQGNSSSHFRPIYDSIKVYETLFRWWWKKW